MQDNHNQDADGDHDDVGDYGPFNSKHIQYNSSYDRILRKQIYPSATPPSSHHLPNPACMGYKSLKISKIPNRYKMSNKILNHINYSNIPCNFTLLCSTLLYLSRPPQPTKVFTVLLLFIIFIIDLFENPKSLVSSQKEVREERWLMPQWQII